MLSDTSERDVRIETPNFVAVFTNKGARLKSWRLKKYQDLVKDPVELIANNFGDAQPLPFSLRVAQDPGVTNTLNSALYSVSGAPSGDGSITAATPVRFEYRDSAGLQVVKEFELDPASYLSPSMCR